MCLSVGLPKVHHCLQLLTIYSAQELVDAHTGYAPLDDANPSLYVQNAATAALLSRTAIANEEVLKGLKVSQEHPALKSVVKPGMTLDALTRIGIQDPAVAWAVFQALWTELTATAPATSMAKDFTPRPPMLVTLDGLAHWMKNSEYRNTEFEPIHAHDLVFVKHFLSLLKPNAAKPTLPNGGLLLYATSASNTPTVYALEVALKQLEARKAGVKPSDPNYPREDPYSYADQRVIEAFSAPESQSAKDTALEIQTLTGLTRDEARGFMEYFAHSGLLRENVNDEWVGEKWSLAGGGVIGELEKLARRLRVTA